MHLSKAFELYTYYSSKLIYHNLEKCKNFMGKRESFTQRKMNSLNVSAVKEELK